MNTAILLITAMDETHRQPLLESQGYSVTTASLQEAAKQLAVAKFQVALVPADNGIFEAVECCAALKQIEPSLRIAVIARRAEYVPESSAIDAVIREQHSPGRFLAAVKKLIEDTDLSEKSFPASNGH